jgi:WD40 repeat protein
VTTDRPPAPDNPDGSDTFTFDPALAAAFGPDLTPGGFTLPPLLRDDPSDPPVVRPASAEVPRGGGERYQLLGEIARGGMGVVLKGRDPDLGRDLAFKVLRHDLAARPEAVQRFVEEAQIGGQLQHPGVVPVYDLGRFADGRPYFGMKLVKGHTLADRLADRASPADDRGRYLHAFLQVCQTVAYAHAKGVVHRDLKPANVMLGAFGEVLVVDWGLAKVLPRGGVADEERAARGRPAAGAPAEEATVIRTARSGGGSGSDTQAGSVMGTPAYMSPEQAGGEVGKVDERADVFGLGAVLCVILTGHPPYVADTGEAVRLMAVRGQLGECFARLDGCGADPELIALCKRCLAAEREERPRDGGAVATAVQRHLSETEGRARRAELRRAAAEAEAREQRKRRRVQLALAAAVFLSLTAGVVASAAFAVRAADKAREAEDKADLAEAKTREADEVSLRLGERAYASDMRLIRSAFEEGRTGFLRDLLDAQRPGPGRPDLRGFEWRYWDRLSTPAMRARGADGLHSLAVSPDGTRAVTGTDRGVVVWDLRTGRALRAFGGHTNLVLAIACGPGGLTLSGSRDGTAVLWDATGGTVLARFAGAGGAGRPVAFSPDGRRFAVGSGNEFTVYDTATRAEVVTRTVEGPNIEQIVFSPDGTRVATGGSEGPVRLLDVGTGREVAAFNVHRGRNSELRGLDLSRDGTRLASSSTTGGVLVWEVGSNAVPVLMAALALPPGIAFLPDGGLVGTTSDGMLHQWDSASGVRVRSVPVHASNCVPAATADGRVVTASFDQTLAVWDVAAWRGRLTGHRSQVTAVAVSPDGRRYASAGGVWDPAGSGRYAGGELKVWDAATGAVLHDPVRDGSGVTSVAFSPDGRLLASGSGTWDAAQQKYTGGAVSLWDAATGRPVGRLSGHGSSVLCLAFSPDGARLASGGFDGTTVVWDVAARKPELTLPADGVNVPAPAPGPDGRPRPTDVRAVAFSPDGRTLAAGGRDVNIRLWDLQARTAREWPLDGIVSGFAYSPDGARLAVVVYGTHLAVHDAATGERRLALEGHRNTATAAAYSPDGSRIATVSEDHTVRVWLAKDGQEILALKGHTDVVRGVAFTRDGHKLVSGGWDKSVRIWDATPPREAK